MRIKKILKRSLIITTSIIVMLYLIMYINVLPLVSRVKENFMKDVKVCDTNYLMYDTSECVRKNISVIPYFTWHNFKDGYIWVNYTCEGYDENGEFAFGSWGVFSKWQIHREDGVWKITDIEEDP